MCEREAEGNTKQQEGIVCDCVSKNRSETETEGILTLADDFHLAIFLLYDLAQDFRVVDEERIGLCCQKLHAFICGSIQGDHYLAIAVRPSAHFARQETAGEHLADEHPPLIRFLVLAWAVQQAELKAFGVELSLSLDDPLCLASSYPFCQMDLADPTIGVDLLKCSDYGSRILSSIDLLQAVGD